MSTETRNTAKLRSPFEQALTDYLQNLSATKKKSEFLAACQDPGKPVTPESVNDYIQRLEQHGAKLGTSNLSRVFKKVAYALKSYDDVIKTFVSADPFPSALIWGGLSVVINIAHRRFELVSSVQGYLEQLGEILARLGRYEPVWGTCPTLQNLLFGAYSCIFQLLSRIHKEYLKTGLQIVISSASARCSKKLNDIITKLKRNEENIRHQILILDGELVRTNGEYQRNWRFDEMKSTISTWTKAQVVTSACHKRLENLQRDQHSGTFAWIHRHSQISAWLDGRNSSSSRVLALHAPPGCGKSTLCAHAIQSILTQDSSAAVAYHFYRFDQQFDAASILQHLASQLFHTLEPTTLCSVTVLETLQRVVRDENTSTRVRAERLIEALIQYFPVVWIFIDGLDEESGPKRWSEASLLPKFLLQLSSSAQNVRVWSTSQKIPPVCAVFKDHIFIEVETETRNDVEDFLLRRGRELDLAEDDQQLLLCQFEKDRFGCFLWANYIIRDLEMARSPADKQRILWEGPTLEEYYQRFFERIPRKDRPLACKIFSLVAYARRPLRLGEIQEALSIHATLDKNQLGSEQDDLSEDHIIFPDCIKRLSAPLIVFDFDSDSNDEICHLYHSATLRFLALDPVFKDEESNTIGIDISPLIIAECCIGYLSQGRFSELLHKETVEGSTEWVDSRGISVEKHQFLLYAAKYWDKHLDSHWARQIIYQIYDPSRDALDAYIAKLQRLYLPDAVTRFLRSRQFRTCLQVQCLYVDAHFLTWRHDSRRDQVYHRRVFPDWLEKDHSQYRRAYDEFCAEWLPLLYCPEWVYGVHPVCCPHLGELGRCWWGSLSQSSFLRGLDGMYTSFRVEALRGDCTPGFSQTFFTNGGKQAISVHLCFKGELACVHLEGLERGTYRFDAKFSETHILNSKRLDLAQYISCSQCFLPKADRSKLIEHTPHGSAFRIGSQLYIKISGNGYTRVDIPALSYLEEIDSRDGIVAIASRRRRLRGTHLTSDGNHACRSSHSPPLVETSDESDVGVASGTSTDQPGFRPINLVHERYFGTRTGMKMKPAHRPAKEPTEVQRSRNDIESSDEDEYDDPSASSSDESNGNACESGSDCSSVQGDNGFESESGEDSGRQERHIISDDEDEEERYNSPVHKDESEPSQNEDSDSEDPEIGKSHLAWSHRQIVPYGEEVLSSDEEEAYFRIYVKAIQRTRRRRKNAPYLARLRVYDTTTPSRPKELFSFATDLQLPLYNSPPVLHPSLSLVVWPLSGGKILFGDFEWDTYFVRKLRPSTPITRHIYMKCHFSPCGSFLHVASLEGQVDTPGKDGAGEHLSLALVAYTFRLCSKQPTRSPPNFHHKARVDIGQFSELAINDAPIELTWTPKALYVTERWLPLRVFRIDLFPPKEGQTIFPVTRPAKTIVLPVSSFESKVQFFPSSDDGESSACIVVSRQGRPALGCFLDEKKDLGGWERAAGIQDAPDPHRDGKLVRPLERFDIEDDCDLQPFLFLE